MRDIALVTAREFTERVRSRAFLISNGAIILIIVLSMALPALLSDDGPTRLGAVEGPAREVAAMAISLEGTFDIGLEVIELVDDDAAAEAVDAGEVDAALLDADTVLVERSLGSQLEGLLTSAANAIQLDRRLVEAGVDPAERAELFATEPLTVRSRGENGEVADPFSPSVVVAFVGVFMLYGLLVLYGQWVAQGIVEEKQSRVVELLLATVRPVELLAGKILGLGLLGLLQILLLAGVGLAGITVTSAVDLPSRGYGALGLVVAWYVLGYLIYATLFAMAGALVSRVEDLQSAVMPVILVLVLALLGAQVALGDPTSTIAGIAGLVPFTAPIVQPVLAASDATTWWEMALAALIAVATIGALLPLSGRIYRGGVLATRGRLSLGAAWRSSRSPGSVEQPAE